ncbi:MAG: bifunctional oligoribonuclease/PAP phosphatase NrnA [Candidatus Eisenbacteria bacterium]|nr:bifunctional oligoribonuclease/PAP phosphatase NrnA [Candidatus Eisenbacteria bacterium]
MSLVDVVHLLNDSDSFVVTSHVDLDGDALGSELGLALVLKRMGKHVRIVNQDRSPLSYRFLPGAHLLEDLSGKLEDLDAALVLDCTCMERTGGVAASILKSRVPIVNIDHHSGNVHFGSTNFVRPDACAAALLILQIIDELGQSVGPEVATCLYAAILAETGSFRLSNTSAEALSVSARLAGEGANPSAIAAQVYDRRSPATLRLIGSALSSLEIAMDGAVSIISIERSKLDESKIASDELEGIVNFAMAVEGVKAAVSLRELPGGIVKVSLRSSGAVDVDLVARQFGGGGHSNAAGAKVNGTLAGVKGIVLEKIADVLAGR